MRDALSLTGPMRVNVALGLLAVAVGLMVLALPEARNWVRMVAATAGMAVAALGVLTMSQEFGGWNLGIDEFLVSDQTGTARFTVPGRMSPPTAFCFVLLGGALLAAAWRRVAHLRRPVVLGLAATVIFISVIALTGYLFENLLQVDFLSYSRISSHAVLGFLLLGAGIALLMRREGRLDWSLDSATTAGFAAGLAAMALAAGISYQFANHMRRDAAEVNRSLEVQKEIQRLNTQFSEFTVSTGRYIITRNEEALAPRPALMIGIVDGIERLKIIATVEGQQERLRRIEALHAKRIAMSEDIIQSFRARLRAGNPPGPGEPSPLGTVYPALGIEIEKLLRQMETAAYRALEQRQARARETTRRTFLMLPLAVFVGLAILLLALFLLNAGAEERRRARHALLMNSERLGILHEIDQAIMSFKTPVQIAETALPRLRDLLAVPRVSISLFDLEKGQGEWLAAVGSSEPGIGPGRRYDLSALGDLDKMRRNETQVVEVGARLVGTERTLALQAAGVRWFTVVPMLARGELIGSLNFGGPTGDFSSEQIQMAREVAAQLAIAITQGRLDERARQADEQYRLVVENVPVGMTMTAADGRLLSINPALARILGYASVDELMAALKGHTQGVYAEPGTRERYLEIMRREGVVSRFETKFFRKDGSVLWVSMSGRPIGEMHGEQSVLVTMVDDISVRKEQEHRIARLNRVKEMHSGINAAVSHVRERQALLDEVCRIAVEKGGLRAAWVGWQYTERCVIEPAASAGYFDGFLDLVRHSTDGSEEVPGVSADVLASGKAVVTNNMRDAPRIRFREEALARGYLAAIHLPLTVDGAPAGVLVLLAAEAGYFDDEEVKLLEELASDVSLALDSLRKSARLEYLAYYDPLTELPNRSLFHDRLTQSLHSRGGEARLIAVVLLDLERFRRVNETLGRKTGDELLRRVGSRLRRAHESAARISVDVFGLVLRGARTAVEVNRALESILDTSFSEPFGLGGQELSVVCRAGVAVFPDDGADADTLLRNAEAALRRGKSEGERVVFYAPEMNARAAEALAIETRLRRAASNREFVLHYQPKVNIASGQISGLEALIRWQEPGKGLVPPGHFIAVLEETGLIAEVGRWAVEQTFADLRAWAKAGVKVPRVAVNVSSIQLQRKDFVDVMIEEIERGGDNADCLELEVTEGLMMRNVEDSTRKLSILRGMGVTVAIDDFGTGYSSLAYLARLPVDKLKIDRSFISAVTTSGESTMLVTTMIGLAHGLKLSVVAEGVETEEQARMLRLFRCDEAQGYFYSKPQPAAEVEKLLLAGGKLPA